MLLAVLLVCLTISGCLTDILNQLRGRPGAARILYTDIFINPTTPGNTAAAAAAANQQGGQQQQQQQQLQMRVGGQVRQQQGRAAPQQQQQQQRQRLQQAQQQQQAEVRRGRALPPAAVRVRRNHRDVLRLLRQMAGEWRR